MPNSRKEINMELLDSVTGGGSCENLINIKNYEIINNKNNKIINDIDINNDLNTNDNQNEIINVNEIINNNFTITNDNKDNLIINNKL